MDKMDLENLEKVQATPEERDRWRKALEDAAIAEADWKALPEVEERISKKLIQAKEESKNPDFSLSGYQTKLARKLWAWGRDEKNRQALVLYQTKHRQLEQLVKDCVDLLAVIAMMKKDPPRGIFQRGDHARDEIRQRMPHE
jgi:hypothetical protein